MQLREFPPQGMLLGRGFERADLLLEGFGLGLDAQRLEECRRQHQQQDDQRGERGFAAQDQQAGEGDDSAADPPAEIAGEEHADDLANLLAKVS